jgi:glycosyltransferase involved in cell wall biosynthesis
VRGHDDQIPVVTVVIPSGREVSYLRRCLDSIVSQKSEVKLDIVVIAEKYSKEKAQLCLEKGARLIVTGQLSESPNIPKIYNAGVVASFGKLIAFIDDDAVADEFWIDKLYATYIQLTSAGIKVGAVGGRVTGRSSSGRYHERLLSILPLPKYLRKSISNIVFRFLCNNAKNSLLDICESGNVIANFNTITSGVVRVKWLPGCNMMISKDVFNLEMFDPNLYEYFEPDFFLRIAEHGYSVFFNPTAVVNHLPGKRFLYGSDKMLRYILDITYFFFKNKDRICGNFIKFIFRLLPLLFNYGLICFKEKGIMTMFRNVCVALRKIVETANMAKYNRAIALIHNQKPTIA